MLLVCKNVVLLSYDTYSVLFMYKRCSFRVAGALMPRQKHQFCGELYISENIFTISTCTPWQLCLFEYHLSNCGYRRLCVAVIKSVITVAVFTDINLYR